MDDTPWTPNDRFQLERYRKLSEIHFRIRTFLRLDEEAARSEKLEPQQLQLLFAIKGLPANQKPTVGIIAARLCLRHHSVVELVDRLVRRGAITRQKNDDDRRKVWLEITESGEAILMAMLAHNALQLNKMAGELLRSLNQVLANPPETSS